MQFTELQTAVGTEPVFETGLLLAGDQDPADVRRQLSRWTRAGKILHAVRIDPRIKVRDLSDAQSLAIQRVINQEGRVEGACRPIEQRFFGAGRAPREWTRQVDRCGLGDSSRPSPPT